MEDLSNYLDSIKNDLQVIKNKCDIVILVHFEQNEFVDLTEFNEFYQEIVGSGFFIRKVFLNENDLAKDLACNKERYSKTIIYNLPRSMYKVNKKVFLSHFKYNTLKKYRNEIFKNKRLSGEKVIREILNRYTTIKKEFDVFLFADDVTKNDLILRKECAVIESTIYDTFGFVRTFYSESDFTSFILDNKVKPHECIVYNLSCDALKASIMTSFCDLNKLTYTGSPAFVISLLENEHIYTGLLCNHGIKVSNVFPNTNLQGKKCEVLVLESKGEYIGLDPIQLGFQNEVDFSLLSLSTEQHICNEIRTQAEKSAELLGIEDYARFDFIISDEGVPYLADIVVTSHTTKRSSIAYLFTEIYNLKYKDIFKTVLTLTFEKSRRLNVDLPARKHQS